MTSDKVTVICPADCLLPFSNFWKFFVHILCMAGINYCDGVAFDRVGEVPPVGISHVVACPLGDGRLATEEGALDLEDRENCILNISL